MAVEQYISVPMLYVNVIKGDRKPNEKGQILHDFEGEKMFCYVCALNTKQVIAIFVKPEAIEKPGLLEAIQKLRNENPTVIPFVVCLSGPNSELENKLGSLYEEKNLDFGLTVLPKKEAIAEIYQSFTFIKPEANITMVIYKGKKVEDIIDEEEFFNTLLPPSARINLDSNISTSASLMDPDTDTSLELMNINKAMTTPENVDALLNASPAFKDLDSAVKSMINK